MLVVKLLRLLQYTDEYDAIILPKLEKVPFWLTPGEAKVCLRSIQMMFHHLCVVANLLVGEPYDHVHLVFVFVP